MVVELVCQSVGNHVHCKLAALETVLYSFPIIVVWLKGLVSLHLKQF